MIDFYENLESAKEEKLDQIYVIVMVSNPEPDNIIITLDAECPIISIDSYRPDMLDRVHAFIMKTRIEWIVFP